MKTVLTWVILLVCGYSLGVVSFKYQLPPIPWMQQGKNWVWGQMGWEEPGWRVGFKDIRNKVAVNCKQFVEKETAIFLTFGQSNAANYGIPGFDPGLPIPRAGWGGLRRIPAPAMAREGVGIHGGAEF